MRAYVIGIVAAIVGACWIGFEVSAQTIFPKDEPPTSPPIQRPPPDLAFRQAAEGALKKYLETSGPYAPLEQIPLDVTGNSVHSERNLPFASLDPIDALRTAQQKIDDINRRGDLPGWNGATLDKAIPLYDLSGEVIAYLFPVRRDGQPSGYLTIAALDLPNPVLEFATEGPSPLDGMPDLLHRQGNALRFPNRPLYLGLLGYAYEVVTDKAEIRRVFRLLGNQIVEIPEVEARIPLRQRVHFPEVQSQSVSPMAYRLIPGVPDWNQFWGSYGCWSGCSPTAAVNLIGYWDRQGYENLIAGDNWQAAVDEMRTHMGTWCGRDNFGWTAIRNISPGMVTYAARHGYTFSSEFWCPGCATPLTYENYRTQIDANRPLLVDIMSHFTYGDHTVVGVGYDTSGSYLIVHDNWPNTGENVYLQYGSGYSEIYMHTLIPGGSSANRPPNTPQPTSPGDWHVARDGRAPTLCWQNNGDPDGDAVQFFAEVFESAVNAQSGWINDTCWRPATLDNRHYGYQWRVKARDSRGAESGWSSVWHFTIEQPPAPPNTAWQAQYWDNRELRGSPRVNTTESGLYFVRHWGWGNGPHGLPADNWSARFVKTIYFPGGFYRFHCHKDDACRLYIDGQLRIDQWWDSPFEGGDWGGNLSAGYHEIKVEYYEKTGEAALEVWWQGPGFLPYDENCDQNNAWCAEYFLNREVRGTAAVRRSEGNDLWFEWHTDGPASTFPTDQFSARFRRNVPFTCGTYRFHIFADDGVRFWIDDVLRLDEWRDQVASFSVDVSLTTGVHNLRVEHYENGGSAALHVGWEKLDDCAPSVTVDYVSTHYVKPGAFIDPVVQVRVTSGYLDGDRGDHLAFVGELSMGADSVQPIYGLVNEGSTYAFDVVNHSAFRMTAPTVEGTFASRWRLKAGSAFVGPEAAVLIVVDDTPPSVVIQNPAEATFLTDDVVTIQALPEDANGVTQVQFFVGYDDGSGWAWHNLGWDSDGSDGWSQTWSVAGVPDQAGIAFYAYAWDRAGNGAGTAVWDVILDRTPPATALHPLAPFQDSTAFLVTWDAEDNLAGVDRIELQYRLDDGDWEELPTEAGGELRGIWLNGEMGRRYGFRIRGVDRSGNVEPYPTSVETETYINPCSPDEYEEDSLPEQAAWIDFEQAQFHTFCGVGDEDWIYFWATQGRLYVIETGDLGPTTDTVLTLYDADATTVLAENDDIAFPDNLASQVKWTAQADGLLYAKVRHWSSQVAGNAVTYTVRVIDQGPEVYRLHLPVMLR